MRDQGDACMLPWLPKWLKTVSRLLHKMPKQFRHDTQDATLDPWCQIEDMNPKIMAQGTTLPASLLASVTKQN